MSFASELTLLSTYDTPGGGRDIYVKDGIAYVSDGDEGLLIINISDTLNPVLRRSYHFDAG